MTGTDAPGRPLAGPSRVLPKDRPVRCRCGYHASNRNDLEEHVLALMHVDDGEHHG